MPCRTALLLRAQAVPRMPRSRARTQDAILVPPTGHPRHPPEALRPQRVRPQPASRPFCCAAAAAPRVSVVALEAVLTRRSTPLRSIAISRHDAAVRFPVRGLDLSPLVHATDADLDASSSAVYDLRGVVVRACASGPRAPVWRTHGAPAPASPQNHLGGIGGGHYVAHALHPARGTWFCFNDANVTEVRACRGAAIEVVEDPRTRASHPRDLPSAARGSCSRQRRARAGNGGAGGGPARQRLHPGVRPPSSPAPHRRFPLRAAGVSTTCSGRRCAAGADVFVCAEARLGADRRSLAASC